MAELVNIPVDKIDIGEGNVRLTEREKNIEQLAQSIREIGLRSPITVLKRDDKYELVMGQRRLAAVKRLGLLDVPAFVHTPNEIRDVHEARIWSLVENLQREDLAPSDKAAAIRTLFEHYKSYATVAKRLGYAFEQTVRVWVGFDGIWPELKEMVDSGAINRDDAMTLFEYQQRDTAIEIAKKLVGLSGEQKKKVKAFARVLKGAKADHIVDEALRPPKRERVFTVRFWGKLFEALQKAARTEGVEPDSLVQALVKEGLEKRGFYF